MFKYTPFFFLCLWSLAVPASGQSAQSGQSAPPADTPSASTDSTTPLADLRLKETVEVTGSRGQIESGKSSVSSTVVTRKDMEARNVRTVEQAVSATEGVSVFRSRGVGDSFTGIGMRGFNGRSSGQSRVLVLLDGQPINDAYLGGVDWNTLPVDEVDRVEVARGPFSALYGGNALGGVVNILTRPIDRRSFELFTQQGTNNTGSYSARYSDRIAKRIGISLSYAHLRTDGYPAQIVTRTATVSTPTAAPQVNGVTPVGTATAGSAFIVGQRGGVGYRNHALRGRVEYAPNAQTIISAQFLRQTKISEWGEYNSFVRDAQGRTVDSGAAGLVFNDGGVWRRMTLLPSQFLGARQGGGSNTYQGQVLRMLGSKSQLRVQAGLADTPANWTSLPGTAATLAGGAGTYTDQSFRMAFTNVQWGLSTGRHDIAVGTDLRGEAATNFENPISNYLTEEADTTTQITFSNGRAFTQGIYVQDRWALGDRFSVTAGGRFDAWRTYDGETKSAVNQPLRTLDKRSATAVTGKVSALWAPVPETAIRGSVGNAFRSPSIFELYRDLLDAGIFLSGNPALEPERLTAVEAGVRQKVGVVSLDGAIYRNRITNLIYRFTDFAADPAGLLRRMGNAGEAHTKGVELGVGIKPMPWLTARPTYTFTDATITKNPLVPATVGRRVPLVARHAAAMTLSAVQPRWSATVTGRYQGDVYSTDTNTDIVNGVPGSYDPFFEADVAVSVTAAKAATVLLTAENILDRRYFMFYRNPGRMVHLGLRLRF